MRAVADVDKMASKDQCIDLNFDLLRGSEERR